MLFDLLLYYSVCKNKNIHCKFNNLSSIKNLFFFLIAQKNVVLEVQDNDLSGLS